MIIEIKIPSPGESITEVEIAEWLVADGDYVERDQELAEIESDKATLPLLAEESGTIKILAEAGQAIEVGVVACSIDTEGKAAPPESGRQATVSEGSATDAPGGNDEPAIDGGAKTSEKVIPGKTAAESKTSPATSGESHKQQEEERPEKKKLPAEDTAGFEKVRISPLAKRLMEDEGFTIEDIIKGLQRITKEDVTAAAGIMSGATSLSRESVTGSRETQRKRMSMLRRNLSRRLVAVKNETAMLTTFNEVDMSAIMGIRKKYQSAFSEKHGVKLGFMSLFVRAATEALKIYPNVNSFIDGEEIVTPLYCDTGIAVQTEKGLMVPVIRNTESLGLAGIEKKILELADKARKNRISIEDMTGGTFSITNGGVFGSLLSTPILNPPQSAILGMHNIVERPVAIAGKVEIRPMMYVALSYDHRIIDGRESVGFLVKIKQLLENPAAMLTGGADPMVSLLDV